MAAITSCFDDLAAPQACCIVAPFSSSAKSSLVVSAGHVSSEVRHCSCVLCRSSQCMAVALRVSPLNLALWT
eukprot:7782732-Alexandrium_andersonii.AAC.1